MSPEHFKMPSPVLRAVELVTPRDFVVKGPELRIDVITPYDMRDFVVKGPELRIDVITPYDMRRSITVALETEVR